MLRIGEMHVWCQFYVAYLKAARFVTNTVGRSRACLCMTCVWFLSASVLSPCALVLTAAVDPLFKAIVFRRGRTSVF